MVQLWLYHDSRTMVDIIMELLYLWNGKVTVSIENIDSIHVQGGPKKPHISMLGVKLI